MALNKNFFKIVSGIAIVGSALGGYHGFNSYNALQKENELISRLSGKIAKTSVLSIKAINKDQDSFSLLKNSYVDIQNTLRELLNFITNTNRSSLFSEPLAETLSMIRALETNTVNFIDLVKEIEANKNYYMSADILTEKFRTSVDKMVSMQKRIQNSNASSYVKDTVNSLLSQIRVDVFLGKSDPRDNNYILKQQELAQSLEDRIQQLLNRNEDFSEKRDFKQVSDEFLRDLKDLIELNKISKTANSLDNRLSTVYDLYMLKIDEVKSENTEIIIGIQMYFILYFILFSISLLVFCLLLANSGSDNRISDVKARRYKKELDRFVSNLDKLVLSDNKINYSYRLVESSERNSEFMKLINVATKKINLLVDNLERSNNIANKFISGVKDFYKESSVKIELLDKDKNVHKDNLNIGINETKEIAIEFESANKVIDILDNNVSNITNEVTNAINAFDKISFDDLRENTQSSNKKIKKIAENITPLNEKIAELKIEVNKIDLSMLNILLLDGVNANGELQNIVKELKNVVANTYSKLDILTLDTSKLEKDVQDVTGTLENIVANLVTLDKKVSIVKNNTSEIKTELIDVREKLTIYSDQSVDILQKMVKNIKEYEYAKLYSTGLYDIMSTTKVYLNSLK